MDTKSGIGSVLSMVPVVGNTLAGVYGLASSIFGKSQKTKEQEQLEQQQKLQDQQIKGSKELADYSQQKQKEMWDYTNIENQVEHYKNAGMNPGLMYGMGGGGGVTTGGGTIPMPTGGQAPDAVKSKGMDIQEAMALSQIALNTSQAQKIKAETQEITEANIPQKQTQTANVAFQNELNKTIGLDAMWKNWQSASDKLWYESRKTMDDYNAWAAGNFAGKPTDNDTTPLAKAYKAGAEKTLQDLINAKTQNNIQQATATIEEYKAGLAAQGIPPDSPWYAKIIGDTLSKAGINPIKWVTK